MGGSEERGGEKGRDSHISSTDDSSGICSAVHVYTSSVSMSLNNDPRRPGKWLISARRWREPTNRLFLASSKRVSERY
jgi:hypothetical protein